MRVWCSSALASFVAPRGGSTTCSSSAPVAHEQCIDCLLRPGTLLHNQAQWLTAEGDCVVGMVDRNAEICRKDAKRVEGTTANRTCAPAGSGIPTRDARVHSRRELCTLARRSHRQRLAPAQREAHNSVNTDTLRRERRAQARTLNHESCSLLACPMGSCVCTRARLGAVRRCDHVAGVLRGYRGQQAAP